MLRLYAVLCIAASLLPQASAHVRWQCPTPRSPSSGIKQGPCGTTGDGIGSNNVPRALLQPGPVTIQWEETISHNASPFRIALSADGEDEFEDCILMDHIPHATTRESNLFYTITIDIPDVQCEFCALQLIQIMTDKLATGIDFCTYDVALSATQDRVNLPNNCFSNYHSCANVRINGTTPRADFVCQQTADWPLRDLEERRYDKIEEASWGAIDTESAQTTTEGLAIDGLPARYNQAFEGCDVSAAETPEQTGTVEVNPGTGTTTTQPGTTPDSQAGQNAATSLSHAPATLFAMSVVVVTTVL